MSYQKGQRVVCINDQFPAIVRQAFQALPVKGQTYTVRAVYLGRSDIAPTAPGASDGEVGLLLEEIRNQDHEARFNKYGLEPGFSSQRFAPLVGSEAEAEEANAARCGFAAALSTSAEGGDTRHGIKTPWRAYCAPNQICRPRVRLVPLPDRGPFELDHRDGGGLF